MSLRRLTGLAVFVTSAGASVVAAQDKPAEKPADKGAATAGANTLKGTWVGFAILSNNTQQRVTFVFDSTATGWQGATSAPEMGPDSLYLTPFTVKGDSVVFGIPIPQAQIGVRGKRAGNSYEGDIYVNGAVGGTMRLARAGSAELANLLTPPLFDDRRRR